MLDPCLPLPGLAGRLLIVRWRWKQLRVCRTAGLSSELSNSFLRCMPAAKEEDLRCDVIQRQRRRSVNFQKADSVELLAFLPSLWPYLFPLQMVLSTTPGPVSPTSIYSSVHPYPFVLFYPLTSLFPWFSSSFILLSFFLRFSLFFLFRIFRPLTSQHIHLRGRGGGIVPCLWCRTLFLTFS